MDSDTKMREHLDIFSIIKDKLSQIPDETIEYKWALDVTDYELDSQEEADVVHSYTPLPQPPEAE